VADRAGRENDENGEGGEDERLPLGVGLKQTNEKR
jgi:hypothetical protein